jgi:hypothetical protein
LQGRVPGESGEVVAMGSATAIPGNGRRQAKRNGQSRRYRQRVKSRKPTADLLVAMQPYQRGLTLRVIENAPVLATWRPIRPADAPPLGPIRSLVYFLPVIEEVLELRVSPDYFDYLRHKLARAGSAHACGVDDDDGSLIQALFPVLFFEWVASAKRYWVTATPPNPNNRPPCSPGTDLRSY